MQEKDGTSLREFRDRFGIKLDVSDFIPPRGACESPRLYLPIAQVPDNWMDEDKTLEAQLLLERCMEVVSPWGDFSPKKETEEFKIPAAKFKEITGFEVWDILSEARSQRDSLLQIE